MHPQAMLNKVSTGNSLLDVVMCFVLPLALRWLVPHVQAVFEYITKVRKYVLCAQTSACVFKGVCAGWCRICRFRCTHKDSKIDTPMSTHKTQHTQREAKRQGHERFVTYTQRSSAASWGSVTDIDKEPPNHLLHAGERVLSRRRSTAVELLFKLH